MAHGVAVIAADSCGPTEIIQHGITGLLFKPDDANDLVNKMQLLAADQTLRFRLTRNAARHIASNFQAKQTADKIVNVYETLLEA